MILTLKGEPPSDENNARIALYYNNLRQAGSNLFILDGNAFCKFQGDGGNVSIP